MPNLEMISVIVPTKNSAGTLKTCLTSARNQSYKNVELIVVDNGSTDQTISIANKYADKVFDKGPERSAQRNYGVANSSGEYVLIIDSDMELTHKVLEECVIQLNSHGSIHALIISEESVGTGFWSKCKRLERSFYAGVDWMEAARCFRKSTFDDFFGYDEENTGTEDYDLPQRIEFKLGRNAIARITPMIIHHEGYISLLFSCRKKFYYARRLDVYKTKSENSAQFKKQSNPLYRYLLFFKQPIKLFRKPIIGLGMLFMKTSEFLFGFSGYILRARSSSVATKIYKNKTNK